MDILQDNSLIVTLDLDWACESAIEETLDFLQEQNIPTTVFITHISKRVQASFNELDIGLHPFFGSDSSHGSTINEVAEHVMNLPHNLPAFRCHRFAMCNISKQAMKEKGMMISSNVCTDLEVVLPFKDRFGFLEMPIFLEDGAYLMQQHPLINSQFIAQKINQKGPKVLLIHPMHFALNTPNFDYMKNIKNSLSRRQWNNMTKKDLNELRSSAPGIRDLLVDILNAPMAKIPLKTLAKSCLERHNHP